MKTELRPVEGGSTQGLTSFLRSTIVGGYLEGSK